MCRWSLKRRTPPQKVEQSQLCSIHKMHTARTHMAPATSLLLSPGTTPGDIETGSCQNLMELASHQLLVWFARLTSRSPATEAQRFPCKGHQTSTSSTPNPRLSLPWQNILENIPSHFQIKVWIQHKLRLLAYCPCVCQLKEMPVTQAPLPCTAFSPLPILFL